MILTVTMSFTMTGLSSRKGSMPVEISHQCTNNFVLNTLMLFCQRVCFSHKLQERKHPLEIFFSSSSFYPSVFVISYYHSSSSLDIWSIGNCRIPGPKMPTLFTSTPTFYNVDHVWHFFSSYDKSCQSHIKQLKYLS